MTRPTARTRGWIRPAVIAAFTLLLPFTGLRALDGRSHADTLKDQERILSSPGNAVTILSSTNFQDDMVTHDLVCEIRDEVGGYGFAHFKRAADGHFRLAEQRIQPKEAPVVTAKIMIQDQAKLILMYDRSGIDHARVTFTDGSGKELSEVRVPYHGHRYEIIDAPAGQGGLSWSVRFYDASGDLL